MTYQEKIQSHYEALQKSSEVNRTLGITYILFLFYVSAKVLGTSDLDLFKPDSQILLPLVDIGLPLKTFYITVPLLLLLFQTNFLFNLQKHAEKLLTWRNLVLSGDDSDSPMQENIQKLHPFIFNYFIDKKNKWVLMTLRLLVVTMVFVYPVFIQTLIFIRFADYQSLRISTWHWVAFCLTLISLWIFQKPILEVVYFKRKPLMIFKRFIRLIFFVVFATYGIYAYAFTTTGDSEKFEKFNLSLRKQDLFKEKPTVFQLNAFPESQRNSISLAETKGYYLRNRSFREADFQNSDLSKNDLRGADFQGADLRSADFKGADLRSADFKEANLRSADFIGADLYKADFQGVNLFSADFKGANLRSADFKGADLRSADFKGANLYKADFQGANLGSAVFKGAVLRFADFKEADLRSADFKGASLRYADFKGTSLWSADFKGTSLWSANFKGASLRSADFKGASLQYADFKGANLWAADFQGAIFINTNLEEVKNIATLNSALVLYIDEENINPDFRFPSQIRAIQTLTPEFRAIRKDIARQAPEIRKNMEDIYYREYNEDIKAMLDTLEKDIRDLE